MFVLCGCIGVLITRAVACPSPFGTERERERERGVVSVAAVRPRAAMASIAPLRSVRADQAPT